MVAKLKTVTLGCKVNQYETQFVREGLIGIGYTDAAQTEPADLIAARTQSKTGALIQEKRTRIRPKQLRSRKIPLELNVMGLTVNEALRLVEEYLDQLLLADIREARILHGKGTGALRDAVQSYLGSCRFISEYGFAPPNLGGDGVTEFKISEST